MLYWKLTCAVEGAFSCVSVLPSDLWRKILSWCIKVATQSVVRCPLLLSKICACSPRSREYHNPKVVRLLLIPEWCNILFQVATRLLCRDSYDSMLVVTLRTWLCLYCGFVMEALKVQPAATFFQKNLTLSPCNLLPLFFISMVNSIFNWKWFYLLR